MPGGKPLPRAISSGLTTGHDPSDGSSRSVGAAATSATAVTGVGRVAAPPPVFGRPGVAPTVKTALARASVSPAGNTTIVNFVPLGVAGPQLFSLIVARNAPSAPAVAVPARAPTPGRDPVPSSKS
jgi:hypothetical protein